MDLSLNSLLSLTIHIAFLLVSVIVAQKEHPILVASLIIDTAHNTCFLVG